MYIYIIPNIIRTHYCVRFSDPLTPIRCTPTSPHTLPRGAAFVSVIPSLRLGVRLPRPTHYCFRFSDPPTPIRCTTTSPHTLLRAVFVSVTPSLQLGVRVPRPTPYRVLRSFQ